MIDMKRVHEEVESKRRDHYSLENTLGDLFRSLLHDYKIILIRITWFKMQYKGEIKQELKMKINTSIKQVESAIAMLMSQYNAERRAQIIKDVDDANMASHMVLKEQMMNLDDNTLFELTEVIEAHLNKKFPPLEEKKE